MTAHDAALVKAHPKERLRRHSAVALALFALLFTLLLAVIAGFGAAMAVVDRTARVLPDYERIDLAPYLAKESYTEEDYDVLYHQTGLSRTAVDALEEKEMLLAYQEAFFYEGVLDHYMAAPTTPHCVLYTEDGKSYYAPIAPLEDGDILVTSTCHTFGWRNGHAAIPRRLEQPPAGGRRSRREEFDRLGELVHPRRELSGAAVEGCERGGTARRRRMGGQCPARHRLLAVRGLLYPQGSGRRPLRDALQPPRLAGVQALRL